MTTASKNAKLGAAEEERINTLIERADTNDENLDELMAIRDVHREAMTAEQKGRLDIMVAALDVLFVEIDEMAGSLQDALDRV